ncbi:DUF2268 domain-containing putative Zn-dependent protease [Paracoccus sp. (in: a-proteobacteria)]|uniref:DUF2268 domain-containing putative Zn-dependent protease n=1 Tax=Paracoccus sp. TaxID=267 RepID=UPI00272C4686|nr:DUF2268 domain-containing putative Zn-dependent protease [Paracoccus sp. (in: a-proteobacteria)]
MTVWQVHMLNARGALTPIMAEIRAHAREVVELVSARLDLPRFDLVVRRGDAVIPEWGIAGHAPSAGVIELVLDPDRVDPEHFRRMLARQMFHLTRWEMVPVDRSLGEALVAAGLAGHFVTDLLGGGADPWDQVRPGSGMLKQAAALWARRDQDMGEWFQGRGRMRKWSGHGLGHRIVAEHLTEGGDAAALVHASADGFRPALRRLMAMEGVEEPEALDPPVAEEEAAEAPGGEAGGASPPGPPEDI